MHRLGFTAFVFAILTLALSGTAFASEHSSPHETPTHSHELSNDTVHVTPKTKLVKKPATVIKQAESGPIIERAKITSAPVAEPRAPAEDTPAPTDLEDVKDAHRARHEAISAPVAAPVPTLSAPVNPPAAVAGPGVSAEQSLKWLTNGNTRYVRRTFRSDGRSASDRKRLVAGQRPHAIILSCADSSVPTEMVFDQALGEIFVIRVAGEALDTSVIASIEYAVQNLNPRLLVVMGHSQCGAVSAALNTKEGESAGSADLDRLLSDIRPRLKSVSADARSTNLEVEAAVNADGVSRDLMKRSELIRRKVDAGELVIKSALYRIDTGRVSFY